MADIIIRYAKIEGDLTLTKIGQSGGTVFLTNDVGSLTIIPQSEHAKLVAELTLAKTGAMGGTVFKTNDVGSLTITPDSGSAKIEGSLTVVDNLTIHYLSGNGNAYACIDQNGKFFRSLQPCV